jgi:hemoglobin
MEGIPMASLYDRIGGAAAVDAAVGLFYSKVLADGRLAKFFDGVNMDLQKGKMKTLLTTVFGGPNQYSGKDMRSAHAHLVRNFGLNESHFNAVAENLASTLRILKVPEPEIKEVLAIANSVKGDVLAG